MSHGGGISNDKYQLYQVHMQGRSLARELSAKIRSEEGRRRTDDAAQLLWVPLPAVKGAILCAWLLSLVEAKGVTRSKRGVVNSGKTVGPEMPTVTSENGSPQSDG